MESSSDEGLATPQDPKADGPEAVEAEGRKILEQRMIDLVRLAQRRARTRAAIRALFSLAMQSVGGYLIWRHEPMLALGLFMVLWGYGTGLRAVFASKRSRRGAGSPRDLTRVGA